MRRICSCTALSMFRLQYLINPTDEARGRDGLGLGGEVTFHIPGILFEVSAKIHFISFPVGITFRKSPHSTQRTLAKLHLVRTCIKRMKSRGMCESLPPLSCLNHECRTAQWNNGAVQSNSFPATPNWCMKTTQPITTFCMEKHGKMLNRERETEVWCHIE